MYFKKEVVFGNITFIMISSKLLKKRIALYNPFPYSNVSGWRKRLLPPVTLQLHYREAGLVFFVQLLMPRFTLQTLEDSSVLGYFFAAWHKNPPSLLNQPLCEAELICLALLLLVALSATSKWPRSTAAVVFLGTFLKPNDFQCCWERGSMVSGVPPANVLSKTSRES